MSRIVQVANFVSPHSGGIRTVLSHLAEGYAGAGHEVLQIVPGPARRRTAREWGELLELPGHLLPGTGYHVLAARAAAPAIAAFAPHRLEVHDRSTLRSLGGWARRAGIGSSVVTHERLDRLAEHWTRGRLPTRRFADASNRRLAAEFDTVVCTTEWAAAEFRRIAVPNVRVVPLGVDHERFTPRTVAPALRRRYARDHETLIAMAIRLSPEKRPGIGIDTARELVGRGRPVRLIVAGDGPLRGRLERAARDLPVTFLGHVSTPELATVFAMSDLALAPAPAETFGLAALEAMACGTPVVADRRSALPSIVGRTGRAADACGRCFADAVDALLALPTAPARAAAQARALDFDWARTVHGLLSVHGLAPAAALAA